jgi:hypothetical protein
VNYDDTLVGAAKAAPPSFISSFKWAGLFIVNGKLSKMAASETKLGLLHDKVAEVLMEALEGEVLPGFTDDDGEVTPDKRLPPSAAIIAAATKFLKDNEITCTPADNNTLGELEKRMEARRSKRSASVFDLDEARAAAQRSM